jgi:5-methylthioadenosine/S-adenosylhomocysteine deaminase
MKQIMERPPSNFTLIGKTDAEPRKPSRRGFFKKSAGYAGGVAAGSVTPSFLSTEASAAPQQNEDARIMDRLERTNADPRRRILLRAGAIVSMDAKVGNLARADVLIEGKKILEIGPDLSGTARDGKAIVVDARDTIVMPGFCDPHIHAWEGQIARIIPNSNGIANDAQHNYFTVVHQTLGPHYRPEDMYVGNLLTALSCIDAGITSFCDNSHNSRSSSHADSAIRALFDSGVRAVYAGGPIRYAEEQTWEHQWPEDLRRIKRQYFTTDDQLVTLRMLFAGALDPKTLSVARDLDLWLSWDGGAANPQLPELYKNGLLVGKESYNHGTGVPEANWQLIREHGAKVNVCPRSDSQFTYGGTGKGYNGLQDALDHGVRPGISNDNASAYAIDMFLEMQVLYYTQRSLAQLARFNRETKPPAAISVRDILEFATIRGAECCALDAKCGSLTPGKEADIVLLRTGNIRQFPLNNAIGAIVQAGVGDVDTVFIAGQAKKWRGRMTSKLAGQDFGKLRQRADDSRQYLFAKAGWPLDIFAD